MNELCYSSAAEFSPCFKHCGVTRRVRKALPLSGLLTDKPFNHQLHLTSKHELRSSTSYHPLRNKII